MGSEGPKTRPTGASVPAFLAALPDARRADARGLVTLMRKATGTAPRLWGTSIVGFGGYRRDVCRRTGSRVAAHRLLPRKSELVLYLMPGTRSVAPLLARLGKHRTGKACLYVRSLADLDLAVLEELVARAVAAMAERRVDRAVASRRTRAVRRRA